MPATRTTVTLDSDVRGLLEREMQARGISLKQAINEALRVGLQSQLNQPSKKYLIRPRNMGYSPDINLDKANQLAAEMQDEETIRKMGWGK